ncbi:hypothetical protein [Vreelandella rituensis]|nr:hypothetical protein [Halomonas rituensis]
MLTPTLPAIRLETVNNTEAIEAVKAMSSSQPIGVDPLDVTVCGFMI